MSNDLVLEATFATSRFSTYRAYKANFTGYPDDNPALKAFSFGAGSDNTYSMTNIYVSWNGATEVKTWTFFASHDNINFEMLGTTPRKGFETQFSEKGVWQHVYAEAVSAEGTVLGRSEVGTPQSSLSPLLLSSSSVTGNLPAANGTNTLSHATDLVAGVFKQPSMAVIVVLVVLFTILAEVALVMGYFLFKTSFRIRLLRWRLTPGYTEDKVHLLSTHDYGQRLDDNDT
jgi:hypothetical protein